jgi:hypothetical protein
MVIKGKHIVIEIVQFGSPIQINNEEIRVAPCNSQEELLSGWIEAKEEIIIGESEKKQGDNLGTQIYGLNKRFFDLTQKFRIGNYGSFRIIFPIGEELIFDLLHSCQLLFGLNFNSLRK